MIDVTYSTKDWSDFWYNSNQIYPMKETLTAQQFDELKERLVNRLVDTMSLNDLINYVSEDLADYYDKLTLNEVIEEADYHFGTDELDEVIKNICSEDRLTNVQV